MAAVDQVENPPVNPLHGAGRSYGAVQAELAASRDAVRSSAAAPPIFHSDYILFKVAAGVGAPIVLGRVKKAPWQGALVPDVAVDVTEYAHTPHPDGIPGYFGTFTPKRNPQYDANARGSIQFVRHCDILHSSVVVFNVKTFSVK